MKRLYFSVFMAATVATGYAQTDSLETFGLPLDTIDNGASQEGMFETEFFTFPNTYVVDTVWGDSWSGWAISTMRDSTTAGFGNQYSAIAGSGAGGSATYAIGYPPYEGNLEIVAKPIIIPLSPSRESAGWKSIDVCNTTYAYKAMKEGDTFSKKFGGATGNDPDFFILHIIHHDFSGNADTIDVYLADFRDTNNANDYILGDWLTVDLSAFTDNFSNYAKLEFAFSSSDTALGYINTPTYIAIDNISYTVEGGSGLESLNTFTTLDVVHGAGFLDVNTQTDGRLRAFLLDGRLPVEEKLPAGRSRFKTDRLPVGISIIVVENAMESASFKFYRP